MSRANLFHDALGRSKLDTPANAAYSDCYSLAGAVTMSALLAWSRSAGVTFGKLLTCATSGWCNGHCATPCSLHQPKYLVSCNKAGIAIPRCTLIQKHAVLFAPVFGILSLFPDERGKLGDSPMAGMAPQPKCCDASHDPYGGGNSRAAIAEVQADMKHGPVSRRYRWMMPPNHAD